MNIRPDFQSVSDQLTRLLVYSEQAREFNLEDWSHLKNGEDFHTIYGLDDEVRLIFEKIYGDGRDLAVWMSSHYSNFNDVGTFPTLKLYVESFSESWVYGIQSLKNHVNEAKTLIRRRGAPWAVREMVKLYEKEITILEATAVIVEELKTSELYQREAGIRQTNKSKKLWESVDALFGIIEACGLVVWILAEVFNSSQQHVIHCSLLSLAIICFLGGGAHFAHKTWKKPFVIWPPYAVVCIIIAVLVFRNSTSTTDSGHVEKASVAVENQQKTLTGWLPPKLPENCSNVTVFFGSQGFIYPRLIAEISPDGTGTKFAIKDLPDFFLQGLDKMTNYSPRKRDMWIKYRLDYNVGGKSFPYPIQPIIVSNRLYVQVEIPFRNEERKVVMSDDFDSELPIPKLWDRNYSTNPGIYFYEVVNELTNPVLQVFYTAPNEVHVNGIFHVDADSILASFGADPQLLTASNRIVDLKTNQQRFTTVSLQSSNFSEVLAIHTNDSVDLVGEMLTNEFYRPVFPGQMRVFKYPSNRNPGAFEDWVKIQPSKTNSASKAKK